MEYWLYIVDKKENFGFIVVVAAGKKGMQPTMGKFHYDVFHMVRNLLKNVIGSSSVSLF